MKSLSLVIALCATGVPWLLVQARREASVDLNAVPDSEAAIPRVLTQHQKWIYVKDRNVPGKGTAKGKADASSLVERKAKDIIQEEIVTVRAAEHSFAAEQPCKFPYIFCWGKRKANAETPAVRKPYWKDNPVFQHCESKRKTSCCGKDWLKRYWYRSQISTFDYEKGAFRPTGEVNDWLHQEGKDNWLRDQLAAGCSIKDFHDAGLPAAVMKDYGGDRVSVHTLEGDYPDEEIAKVYEIEELRSGHWDANRIYKSGGKERFKLTDFQKTGFFKGGELKKIQPLDRDKVLTCGDFREAGFGAADLFDQGKGFSSSDLRTCPCKKKENTRCTAGSNGFSVTEVSDAGASPTKLSSGEDNFSVDEVIRELSVEKLKDDQVFKQRYTKRIIEDKDLKQPVLMEVFTLRELNRKFELDELKDRGVVVADLRGWNEASMLPETSHLLTAFSIKEILQGIEEDETHKVLQDLAQAGKSVEEVLQAEEGIRGGIHENSKCTAQKKNVLDLLGFDLLQRVLNSSFRLVSHRRPCSAVADEC
eukprot:gnl/MRDRNA2_/MRDRNA2_78386_c0_seq1.p2 gnl/MRDRNA2_/MRDRNA2_78386_c0~~gnl/MRDRNA2_/MRDRNA2_78386_c0_seq1.p2  ORF type:complete len:533 (+),score=106.34 gnl/MRDRNA2_/MRDRNA2_78386_c0_seq1:86-1684(+)